MKLHLKELVCNDMIRILFPNLCKIATISFSIPVSTASVKKKLFPDEVNKDPITKQPK